MAKKRTEIIFLAAVFSFLFMVPVLWAVEGHQVDGWWTDYNGVNHQCPPDCGGSSSSSSSSSSGWEYNPNSAAAQFGRDIRQGIRSALGLDYTPPVKTANQQKAEALNQECKRLSKADDWDGAVTCFQNVVNLDPADPIYRQNLKGAQQVVIDKRGKQYYYDGDYEMAISSFKEALTYGPDKNIESNLRVAEDALKQEGRKKEARKLNDDCLQYRLNGDFDKSFSCYEKAISLDPSNPVLKNNLKFAKMDKANTLALKYFKEQNWDMAIKYLKEALSYGPDENIQNSLVQAEGTAKLQQQEKEEDAHRIDLAQAKEKINTMLGNFAGDFDGSAKPQGASNNQLEFIGGNQPFFSLGDRNSAPVELSEKESGKEVLVDPGKMDEIVKESSLAIKEVPLPEAADPYFSKPKTDIILDALEKGRIYGKNKPSDLDVSVKYVKDYLLTRDPGNANAREALSYLEGMRESAALHHTPSLEEIMDRDTKGPQSKNPLGDWWKKRWKEKRPAGTTSQGLTLPENVPVPDYVPSSEGSQQLAEAVTHKKESQVPEEVLKQWHEQRTDAVYYALREGKNDVNQAIDFLTKKINKDPTFTSDSPARSALNYLRGYQGYKEYEENLKK